MTYAQLTEALEEQSERLLKGIAELLKQIPPPSPGPGPATKAKLTLGGSMASQHISVDAVDESVTVSYQDDKNEDTAAPAGAAPTFTSSDETIATVAPDPADPLKGKLTLLLAGDVDLGASNVNDANGNPIQLTPQTVTVDPGAAAGARITVAP